MTLLLPSRRGFLVGLAPALAAPAVVRSGSLMPIKAIDPFDTRYLLSYMIGTDSLALRIDKATVPLVRPTLKHCVRNLTRSEAEQLTSRDVVSQMLRAIDAQMVSRPGKFKQVSADVRVSEWNPHLINRWLV